MGSDPKGLRLGPRGFRTTGCWAHLINRFGKAIPPLPSFERVRPARIPAPPRLSETATPVHRALVLAQAYTSAVTHYYKVSRVFDGVTEETLQDRSQYMTLLNAQSIILKMKIAPIAWCAFSCEFWLKTPRGRQNPPVRWMFATSRLQDREEWFSQFAQRYIGGKTIVPSAYKELATRHRQMYRALLALGDSLEVPEEDVLRTVNEFLPRKLYDRLVERADDEVEEIEHDIERALRKGAFLW